jgi:F0F1-type ATP synthase assembly protein I
MAEQQKPSIRRGEMAFIFAIILGLVLGILIKRVRLGIILGLILGSAIVFLGWLRVNKK